ncbi:hypothetical protein NKG94_22350 [Micromonospora sp. M12]
MEAALAVSLQPDFRASLRVHNGTGPGATLPSSEPSPVPLTNLCDTDEIIEMTRMWRDNHHPEPGWDDPQVWAYLVDTKMLWLNGPVRPIVGAPGAVVVGDMNGDVLWLLDFDPAPGNARTGGTGRRRMCLVGRAGPVLDRVAHPLRRRSAPVRDGPGHVAAGNRSLYWAGVRMGKHAVGLLGNASSLATGR